ACSTVCSKSAEVTGVPSLHFACGSMRNTTQKTSGHRPATVDVVDGNGRVVAVVLVASVADVQPRRTTTRTHIHRFMFGKIGSTTWIRPRCRVGSDTSHGGSEGEP